MNTPHPTVNWVKNRVRQARDDQQQLFDAGLNGLKLVKREGKVIELGNGEQLTEFLSCSYLGLESDPRLIQGAVQAVESFGVQFAAARTRALLPPMRELDELLNRIFQGHTVTFNSVGRPIWVVCRYWVPVSCRRIPCGAAQAGSSTAPPMPRCKYCRAFCGSSAPCSAAIAVIFSKSKTLVPPLLLPEIRPLS